jgi:hypothetical protein
MAMSGPVCRHIVRRTGQVCGRLVQYEDHACGFHTQLTVTRSHQHRRHGHGESSSGSGTRRRRRRSEPMGTQQQQPARSVRTRTTAADETPANHHPIPPPTPAPTGEECTICYTAMEPAFTRWLSCGHAFHDACIGAWEDTGRNLTCPLCRAPIPTDTPVATPPPSPPAHYYDDFAPLPGVHLGLQHTPAPPSPPAPPNGHEDDHHDTPVRGEGTRRVLFQSPTTSSVVEIDGPAAASAAERLPAIIDVHLDRVRQMIEDTVESTMRRILAEYHSSR